VALHHADSVSDHETAGGLLGDCDRERGAGQFERATDRQRLVVVALEPFLDVKIEAAQPVIWRRGTLLSQSRQNAFLLRSRVSEFW
jgi:hypothetical protein